MGASADYYGRRPMILTALAIFIIGSLLCALAPNIETLTATRVLQGFGGGGLMTLSQALVGETVPPRERGRYQGFLAGVSVASSTFWTGRGRLLTEAFGWRSIFLVNLPLGLICIVWCCGRKRGYRPATNHIRRARPGAVHVVCEPCHFRAARSPTHGRARYAAGFRPFAFGGLALFALIWQERQWSSPLIPPALFERTVGLAQRRLGRLPRRSAGFADHIFADLSARCARRVAG